MLSIQAVHDVGLSPSRTEGQLLPSFLSPFPQTPERHNVTAARCHHNRLLLILYGSKTLSSQRSRNKRRNHARSAQAPRKAGAPLLVRARSALPRTGPHLPGPAGRSMPASSPSSVSQPCGGLILRSFLTASAHVLVQSRSLSLLLSPIVSASVGRSPLLAVAVEIFIMSWGRRGSRAGSSLTDTRSTREAAGARECMDGYGKCGRHWQTCVGSLQDGEEIQSETPAGGGTWKQPEDRSVGTLNLEIMRCV